MELGLALLERFAGDVVLSPYSLARALDVVRAGASGRDARGARRAARRADARASEGVELAQAAWLAPGLPARARRSRSRPGRSTLDVVNAWAREKTHGMIPSIVDHFDPDEKFAITDADLLRGRNGSTRSRRSASGRSRARARCTMMSVEDHFQHAEGAVRLPYGHGDLRFVAMLGETSGATCTGSAATGTVELPALQRRVHGSSRATRCRARPRARVRTGRTTSSSCSPARARSRSARILQRARVDVDERGTRPPR